MDTITFKPLYMERVWGGRELERIYGRSLPEPTRPIGESWEIADRPEAQSVVDSGPLKGVSLHELWTNQRDAIFGENFPDSTHFPILIKVLDARDDLSIQVHPPLELAESLGGEPKTEMWYIADCDPNAKLYVGLKKGVTRSDFEKNVQDGSIADCVHAIEPKVGESIFIASGRLHAIGAGFLIHEIQQNSDTTYRVFDWNRYGLDGKPRELHVEQSLASIDFDDFEPTMDVPQGEVLASCEYFHTAQRSLVSGETLKNPDEGQFSILTVVKGALSEADGRSHTKGAFLIMPKGSAGVTATEESLVLQITLPR